MFTKQNLWRSFVTGLFFVALTIIGAPKADALSVEASAHNETHLYVGFLNGLSYSAGPTWEKDFNKATPGNFSNSLAMS